MDTATLNRLLRSHGVLPSGPAQHRPLSLVLTARQVATGRPLVVKVLQSPLAGARRNFLREIGILKSLAGQPGVARLIAAAADTRLAFHACERADGSSLDGLARAAEGRDLAVILRHGAILANWLVGLHRLDIAHRDLSPDHVFVDSCEALTVVDFGMAKRTRRLTTAERRRCEGYDLQAFGMILWETICGRVIFPYRDPRLPLILQREIALVRGSGLPLPVQRLLRRCLAAHSEFTPRVMSSHRAFKSASQIAASLAELQPNAGKSSGGQSTRPQ